MKIRALFDMISGELLAVRALFFSSRPKTESLAYVITSVLSLLIKRDKIRYLGRPFYYKDRNTPLLLQWYPQEIENLLAATGEIGSCLDIGANVGQFACTLEKYLPNVQVISIEPQREAATLLRSNSNGRVIESCIGKGKHKSLYVTEGKSDRSSTILGVNTSANRRIKVKSIQLTKRACRKLGIEDNYDLVKVDVEGAEIEVIECLREIEWNYLQVEIEEEHIQDLQRLISFYWKGSTLIYKKRVHGMSPSFNYLFARQTLPKPIKKR